MGSEENMKTIRLREAIIAVMNALIRFIERRAKRREQRRHEKSVEKRKTKMHIYTHLHTELFGVDDNLFFNGWMETNRGRLYLFTDMVSRGTLSFTESQFADKDFVVRKVKELRRKNGNGKEERQRYARKTGTG
jgi:hypothetical protein